MDINNRPLLLHTHLHFIEILASIERYDVIGSDTSDGLVCWVNSCIER